MSWDECCNPPDNCEMNRIEYGSNKIIVGKCDIKKYSSQSPGSGGKISNEQGKLKTVKTADTQCIVWSHTAVREWPRTPAERVKKIKNARPWCLEGTPLQHKTLQARGTLKTMQSYSPPAQGIRKARSKTAQNRRIGTQKSVMAGTSPSGNTWPVAGPDPDPSQSSRCMDTCSRC